MDTYVVPILLMLGGLGVFLVGMNMMSANMSKLAHGKLRTMLNKTAGNRFSGVCIGAGATFVVQSSSATTVMVVGLVNAGIMTLFQATAIIMGANIGTTITAHVAALSSFDFAAFLFLLACVGVFMSMLSKKEKIRTIGEVFTGLGMIFVGLEVMSSAMDPKVNPEMMATINNALTAVSNPCLLLLIGILITAIIQSSSAVTSIVIALAINGVIVGGDGDGVLFVIIGSNIGTCVTALLSSIGVSKNAKRAAIIHLLFNVLGALIFTIFLLCWRPFDKTFMDTVLVKMFPSEQAAATRIAMFHTIFNVVCTLLFLPCTKLFVWVAQRLIRETPAQQEKDDYEELLKAPDERLLATPSVALGYLNQRTVKIFSYAMRALDLSVEAFLNKDESAEKEVLKINGNLATINKQETDYLVKLSSSTATESEEANISSLHYVYNDIIRVGELASNVTKYTSHYVNDKLIFSQEFLTKIKEMYNKIQKLYELSSEVFATGNADKIDQVDALEDEIDNDRRELNKSHITRLNEGKCQPQNATVFTNLVGNLERAADHITFIARSVATNK